jgi:CO/xanthine dehydrogenase Mo-binding subunit
MVTFSLFGRGGTLAAQEATPIASPSAPTSIAGPPPTELSAWLAVAPDNTATLFTGKVEQGTGVMTALGQIAAEELDFPFEKLDVVMGTTSITIDQGPSYGSRTVRYAGPQIRSAAAAGRQALIEQAAEHFAVSPNQIATNAGVLSVIGHPDKSITYGELVDGKPLDVEIEATGEKFDLVVAPEQAVKDPSAYTVVGQSVQRKDIPGKVTGEFTYMHDVKIEGMLHGRVVRPYGYGATLEDVDETGLSDIPGFVQVVRKNNFLGVVAETEWAAIKAAELLGSTLDPKGPAAGQATWSDWNELPDQANIWDAVRNAEGTNTTVSADGSVSMALPQATTKLEATYTWPFQLHGSIGPSCAIADVRRDGATLWGATQMPHQAKRDMAVMLDLQEDSIELRWVEGSGQYGRNGHEHVIADAAVMSQAIGKPVRVQWMRWDEHAWEPKGPPIIQDMAGGLDEDGNVVAWQHHMWIPTTGDTRLVASDLAGMPQTGAEGQGRAAITYSYTFPNADVASHGVGKVAFLSAWLRSPTQLEITTAMESFVDELAAAANQDPLDFRLKYLDDERTINVLRAAADAYGWESRPSPAPDQADPDRLTGRGIGWVNRDETRVATIVDVVVDRESGQISVPRVVVSHDCGLVVNPDGMINQVEGNIIHGISRTLIEELTFDNAHVTSRDWAGYPILRFENIPDSIEVVLVNNHPAFPSTGGGEPSHCQIGAAIGNAVFDATGVRLRQVPFTADRVLAALDAEG